MVMNFPFSQFITAEYVYICFAARTVGSSHATISQAVTCYAPTLATTVRSDLCLVT